MRKGLRYIVTFSLFLLAIVIFSGNAQAAEYACSGSVNGVSTSTYCGSANYNRCTVEEGDEHCTNCNLCEFGCSSGSCKSAPVTEPAPVPIVEPAPIPVALTCSDTTWGPSTSTVCSGQSFTQTSNCGNTRTATGTKTTGVCAPQICTSGQTRPASGTCSTTSSCKVQIRQERCNSGGTAWSSSYCIATNTPACRSNEQCSNGQCVPIRICTPGSTRAASG